MICDIVNSSYPEVLAAVKELKKLKDASKLNFADTLKDINQLSTDLSVVTKVSNSAPCCEEDRSNW